MGNVEFCSVAFRVLVSNNSVTVLLPLPIVRNCEKKISNLTMRLLDEWDRSSELMLEEQRRLLSTM